MKTRKLLCLITILLLVPLLCSCGPSRPATVVREYMEAANRGDINAMLDCMEPDAANLIRGVTQIAGAQFGIDSESAMLMAPALMSIANAYGAGYAVEYKILDESISGDRAVVTIDYSASSGGSVQSGENIEIPLVKIGGKWYLAMS